MPAFAGWSRWGSPPRPAHRVLERVGSGADGGSGPHSCRAYHRHHRRRGGLPRAAGPVAASGPLRCAPLQHLRPHRNHSGGDHPGAAARRPEPGPVAHRPAAARHAGAYPGAGSNLPARESWCCSARSWPTATWGRARELWPCGSARRSCPSIAPAIGCAWWPPAGLPLPARQRIQDKRLSHSARRGGGPAAGPAGVDEACVQG